MIKAISVENLSFSYGKNKILDSVSFDVEENSVFFLIGKNGSGKTTLMNCILRYLISNNGIIRMFGKNISEMSLNEVSRLVSYVPQNTSINCEFMIKDYLVLGRNPYISLGNPTRYDYEKAEEYAIKTGIDNLLELKFNELSGGQKQWCAITRALVQETPIIVLDEPMSALDMGRQAEFLVLINELREKDKKTIFLTTHNPNHCIKLQSQVCWINNNHVFAIGEPSVVFTNANVQAIYGKYVRVDEHLYVDFSI